MYLSGYFDFLVHIIYNNCFRVFLVNNSFGNVKRISKNQ